MAVQSTWIVTLEIQRLVVAGPLLLFAGAVIGIMGGVAAFHSHHASPARRAVAHPAHQGAESDLTCPETFLSAQCVESRDEGMTRLASTDTGNMRLGLCRMTEPVPSFERCLSQSGKV